MSGSTFEVSINSNDTILTLKKEIQEHDQGIGTEQQILIYRGKRMQEDKKVSEYGLTSGNVVYMAFDSGGRHRWDVHY